jgi:hypothetical protein
MSAYLEPPLERRPAESTPGSRWESCWVLSRLAGDLLSIPFHLLAFLMTRGTHRRAFRHALEQGARSTPGALPSATPAGGQMAADATPETT